MKNKWWGYMHTSGTIQAKRFFSHKDIAEARESPFVETYYWPFEADNREEALKILSDQFWGKIKKD